MKIRLYTDKKSDRERKPVRLSISLLGRRHMTSLGCNMTDGEFTALSECFYHGQTKSRVKHQRHNELLRVLRSISDKLEWEVEKCNRGEITADSIDIAGVVNECKGVKRKAKRDEINATQLFLKFIMQESKNKDLSKSTSDHLYCIHRDIEKTFPSLSVERVSSKEWLQEYMEILTNRGYNNNSIRSTHKFLHWFLKWAYQNGYCGNDFERFKFELKTVDSHERLVVFLTMDEILAIKNHDTAEEYRLCKDIFLFQCFTGLRYSDVVKIKKSDIRGDMLTMVSQKTGILLHNRLNSMAVEIANRYMDIIGEKLFPHICNRDMNLKLREICKQVGINETVTKYEYRNHERIAITAPKWQFITTHVGRKSFVVNSLDMGLTATQVIGYTGHSSITAMQPYISISQKKKDAAMDVWDNAITASANSSEIDELESQLVAIKKRIKDLKNERGADD